MKYTVLSLFPQIIDVFFENSIMSKAVDRGIIRWQSINIRDYAFDKHKSCDDAPYGGGAGMLMLPGPLSLALEAVGAKKKPVQDDKNPRCRATGYFCSLKELQSGSNNAQPAPEKSTLSNIKTEPPRACTAEKMPPRVIYLSASGRLFNQQYARELAREDELILICGRYEGIDQRIVDLYVDDEISIGDYILSCGETAALTVIDATYRLIDNVITPESLNEESFENGLLEYPQWTRPEEFEGLKVPDVLLSGHHENIKKWRRQQSIEKTKTMRPDLLFEP
ncbi:MAG: hypothetical protein Ta2B_22850 [Termitinemataceae bacterium]|nr:MAG: hypothetical protein Ta2B_22850 [Termitinemataceae bacterium]